MLASALNLLINHNRLLLHMQIMMPHVDDLGGAVASWLLRSTRERAVRV